MHGRNGYLQNFVLALVASAIVLSGCNAPVIDRSKDAADFRGYLKNESRRLAIDPQKPLTMAQCEQLAIRNSLSLRVKNLALMLQDDRIRLAMSGWMPHGRLEYNAQTRSNDSLMKMGDTPAVESEDRNQQNLNIGTVMTLLDFGVTYYSYKISLDRRTQEELEILRSEQLLRRDVRVAYAQHAGAIRQERLARTAYQAAEQVLRVARSLEKEKLQVHADTALVESAVAEAGLNLSLASQRVEETHLALSQLMSFPPGTVFRIYDDLPPMPGVPGPGQVNALEDRALVARPELTVHDLERHISANEVRKQFAEFFPRVDGVAGFHWTSASQVVNDNFFLGGITVTSSLLDGGDSIWRYDLAKKNVDVQTERRLLISLGILYDVQLRALRVKTAHESVVAATKLEMARRESLNRIISLYNEGLEDEAGAATALGNLTIQSTAMDKAQTEYLSAWYELEAAALPEVLPTDKAAAGAPASQPTSRPALSMSKAR
jgi:outer membrane protein TolC